MIDIPFSRGGVGGRDYVYQCNTQVLYDSNFVSQRMVFINDKKHYINGKWCYFGVPLQ